MEGQNNAPQQAVYMTPVQDRGVLIERTQFTEELKNLRVALTGRFFDGKQDIVITEDSLMCQKHFSNLMPQIFMANTKATTLSNVEAATVEYFVVNIINNLEAWVIKNCYVCPSCGVNRDYDKVNQIVDGLEAFFYFNFRRAVNGFEAEKLAQSHQSTEQVVRHAEEKPGGFFSLRNMRLGGNKQ